MSRSFLQYTIWYFIKDVPDLGQHRTSQKTVDIEILLLSLLICWVCCITYTLALIAHCVNICLKTKEKMNVVKVSLFTKFESVKENALMFHFFHRHLNQGCVRYLEIIVKIFLIYSWIGAFLASNFISKWSKKFSNPLFSFHSLKRSLHFYHLQLLGSRRRACCPSSSVDSLMVLDQLIYSWKICIHFNFRL